MSPAGDDLDVVIGELRREAARRRAEPDFPVDDEAQLGVALDRQSPRPLAPKLDRLADAVEAALATPAGPAGSSTPTGRAAQRAAAAVLGPLPAQVSSLGQLLATALHTVSARIQDVDARLQRLEARAYRSAGERTSAAATSGPEGRAASVPEGGASGSENARTPDAAEGLAAEGLAAGLAAEGLAAELAAAGSPGQPPAWLPDSDLSLDGRLAVEGGLAVEGRLAVEGGLAVEGRLLYAGPDAEAAVGSLRRQGLDAYGLTPSGDPYLDHPDVRHGDLATHLEAVGDRMLGAVLFVGTTDVVDPARLPELAAEIGRVTGTVVIGAAAPWWWREQVGPERADTSPSRPLSPETWLAVLHRAGYEGTLDYGPGARWYRVAAGRR